MKFIRIFLIVAIILNFNFLKDLGNPYDIIVSDKDGTASIEWGAYGVPESFLVYQNKIIKRFIGPINNEDLLEIQKIIR